LIKKLYYSFEKDDLVCNYYDFKKLTSFNINKLTNSLNLDLNYSYLNNLKEKFSYNLLSDSFKTTASNYESDKMEDVEETSKNLRTKISNFPVKLVKGVLNKHNVSLLSSNEILNKNILFSYRINNDQVVEKISQVEQF